MLRAVMDTNVLDSAFRSRLGWSFDVFIAIRQGRHARLASKSCRRSLIATALTAQLDHAPHRPTIAERAARVDWPRVDEILARVPAAPPVEGDEK